MHKEVKLIVTGTVKYKWCVILSEEKYFQTFLLYQEHCKKNQNAMNKLRSTISQKKN